MNACAAGLIAGSGDFPVLLFDALRRAGREVVVAGVAGHAVRAHFDGAVFRTFRVGEVGAVSGFFREFRVHEAFMAGGIRRCYGRTHFAPDLLLWLQLPKMLFSGDDAALRLMARLFERNGIVIGDSASVLADSLAPRGHIAGPGVNEGTAALLQRGVRCCRLFARRDVGQAVTVFGNDWVGYENRLGTNALMARTPGPGAVLVKMKKAGQDVRFDRPAVGPSTVIVAKKVGISAIGLEAGEVLMLHKGRMSELCNREKISLVGF